MAKFEKIILPYSFSALEPFIDSQTMETHYGKHHEAYRTKFEEAISKHPELETKTPEELLMDINNIPEDIKTAVKNHGGGFVNHNIFFGHLILNEGGHPVGELADEINKTFGDFDKFKQEFSACALGVFGSGWAWLASDENGENLHIHAHPLQENPLMHGHNPILGLDVWEHAYYLKYQNRRQEYIDNFWNVINWEKVNQNYLNGK